MVAPSIVWFRRDLRVTDHPALAAAAAAGPVLGLYVLDPAILAGRFTSSNRTWFLLGAIDALAAELAARGGRLVVRVGDPAAVVPAVAAEVRASAVHVSRDHAPYGRARDEAVATALTTAGVAFHRHRGNLVHEPEAIATDGGTPYAVFTPFWRRWSAIELRAPAATPERLGELDALGEAEADGLDPARGGVAALPAVAALGLPAPSADPALLPPPGEPAARDRVDRWLALGPDHGPAAYGRTRDRLDDPDATSRLSADLRFGLLSPTEVVARSLAVDGAGDGSRRFVSELAWRDFYGHVLWHHPATAHQPMQAAYADVERPGDDDHAALDAWRAGRTGYPVVDAAMRQLLATGWMANRSRMVVASFLTKDLLADWRIGEAHFMRHLIDGDPASNLGGWQWAASVGTDAQPYFRIFDPVRQGERFDPEGAHVRHWVPELRAVPTARIHAPWTMTPEEQATAGCRVGKDYPAPIVDHAEARRRALAWFEEVRSSTRAPRQRG